jgi:hypothetical protein
MITFNEKDLLLKYLCKNCQPESLSDFSQKECLNVTGLKQLEINSILQYFLRIGIVGSFNLRYSCPTVFVELRMEALDILNRGGLTTQENMLQKEVEKLLLEIERLKPSIGDKIEQVSTIANNIAGIAGSFIGSVTGIKSL